MADKEKPVAVDPQKIPIYYERSRHYRTIRADGAQAGVTPSAGIQVMFYIETRPTPEFVLHRITPEGGLGDEIERIEKQGIIREAQVNVIMDVGITRQFIELLERMLNQIESIQQQRTAKGSGAAKHPKVDRATKK